MKSKIIFSKIINNDENNGEIEMEAKLGAHTKTKIRYHVIICTKYRRKCLTKIRDDLISCLDDLCSRHHFNLLAREIDKDHLHMLISFPVTKSISDCIKLIKQITTYYMWKTHSEYLKKYYWKKRLLWTKSFFCSTIGDVSEARAKYYIDNQG